MYEKNIKKRIYGAVLLLAGIIYLAVFCIPGSIVLFRYADWNQSVTYIFCAIG